jgi:predicted nucleotidyltransferase
MSADPEVLRVLLFGSFARNDYGTRSDLDLLVVLGRSDKSYGERILDYLRYATDYPTDIFPYTQNEIDARLDEGDPFLRRAIQEAVLLRKRENP